MTLSGSTLRRNREPRLRDCSGIFFLGARAVVVHGTSVPEGMPGPAVGVPTR